MRRFLILACAWLCVSSPGMRLGAQPEDGATRLVTAIDRAIASGDQAALRALVRPDVPSLPLSDFISTVAAERPTHSVVKERDRTALKNGRQRLMLEIFTDRGGEGQVSTWRMEAAPEPSGAWHVAALERLTVVSGLFQLSLDTTTEYQVANLSLRAPDLTLTLASGHAFVARVADGPTAVILLGHGRVTFSPKPAAERGQVRIFSGNEVFNSEFESLFVRVNPAEFLANAGTALTPRPVDPSHLRRATQVFDENVGRSFAIDLNDLSADRWYLVPSAGDLVAEIAAGKYGTLTYTRTKSDPEDVSFFDRRRRHNIAVYASTESLAEHGRFFSEDDSVPYDITHYDLHVSFSTDRAWVDGTARIIMHTRAQAGSTLTLRLAEPLVVREMSSPQFGRLLHLRVLGQNNILVGFPEEITPDRDFEIDVTYGGRLPPQPIDHEALDVQTVQAPQQDQVSGQEPIALPPEPQSVYSNRSFWYPQSTVSDYATAVMTLEIPADQDVVASGTPRGVPTLLPASGTPPRPRKQVTFETTKPARYLSCIISRFQNGTPVTLTLHNDDDPVALVLTANPRETSRLKGMTEKTAEIFRFYASLLNDAPYDSFTVALTESDLPGGHSPAYFAIVNEPLPTSPLVWTNDPVAFQNYGAFFLAHEVAHQWWGQAVGWKNYHEQWLSEGFAQYFAALYAEHERGPDVFTAMLRQMRRWSIMMSPQGPVYLGYRLGHIKGDSRVFRALVYNKGAMVLHMLRRLVGDKAFFAGLREFYSTWRFKKASTDDFRVSMEHATGRPLERFFERWIYESGVPTIAFSSTVDQAAHEAHVHFAQKGDVYDVPVTVTVTYSDGTSEDVMVPVTEAVVDRTLPLRGPVRAIEVNRDSAALAEFVH